MKTEWIKTVMPGMTQIHTLNIETTVSCAHCQKNINDGDLCITMIGRPEGDSEYGGISYGNMNLLNRAEGQDYTVKMLKPGFYHVECLIKYLTNLVNHNSK